jgi:hypothetical protein
MNNKPKYKWYDPIIDPPIDRTPEDHYSNNKTKFIGSMVGAAAGLTMVAAPYVDNYLKANPTPIEHPGKHFSRAAGYTLAGASAGHMIGNVVSNYNTYKKRYDKNQAIHTKEEMNKKMQMELGPSFKINAGPSSFQF